MNKLFTKIGVAMVGLAMAIGVGVAVGSNTEVKIASAVSKPADSYTELKWTAVQASKDVFCGTFAKGSAANSTKTGEFYTSNSGGTISAEWSYTNTLVSLASGKDDLNNWVGGEQQCIQYGSGNARHSFEFTTTNVPGVIKYVSIQCSSASASSKVTITVGDSTYVNAADSGSGSAGITTVVSNSTTGTASGQITISLSASSGAIYLKEIVVRYSKTMTISGLHSVYEGKTTSLESNADTTVSWASSTESVATVNSSGVVSGVSTGNATIYASASGYITAEWAITVSEEPSDPYLTVDPTSLTGYAGGSGTLTADFGNLTGALTWEISSGNSFISISSTSGSTITVSYTNPGDAVVKAFDSGAKATRYQDIAVHVDASSIDSFAISVTSKTLYVGDTFKVHASVTKTGVKSTDTNWASSSTGIATVSKSTSENEEDITVTAVSAGTATITATSVGDNTKTATCTVRVFAQPIYQKVTSEPDDWRGTYLIVYETGKYAFDGSLANPDVTSNWVDVSISNDKITGSSTINASTVKVGKYIDGEGDVKYYIKTSSNKYFGRDAASNGFDIDSVTKYTVTFASNGNDSGFTVFGAGGAEFQYLNSGANSKYRFYASSQTPVCLYRMNVDDTINSEVSTYSTTFLSTMTCSGSGSVTAEAGSWDSMTTAYNALSMDAQRELALTTGDRTGTGVAGAIGRYDEIITKHGTSDYPDFMFRESIGKLVLGLSSNISFAVNDKDNSTTLIIILVSSISLVAIAGYFVIRRRKEQ